jgi:hypothetical protein
MTQPLAGWCSRVRDQAREPRRLPAAPPGPPQRLGLRAWLGGWTPRTRLLRCIMKPSRSGPAYDGRDRQPAARLFHRRWDATVLPSFNPLGRSQDKVGAAHH